MTNYQELKRLAEAATVGPWIAGNDDDSDYYLVGPVAFDRVVTHPVVKLHNERNADYIAAASPDVVLGLIKSLEHTTMAAEAEAKEVDERNAVIAGLRTQNQALMEALERMVESVTGVDQVSAVDEARAALTAAKQAQPERAPLSDAELEQEFCNITGLETGINPAAADTKRALVWFKKGYAHGIKQGGQHD